MRSTRATPLTVVALALALVLAAPVAVEAQVPDFSGTWNLDVEATEPPQEQLESGASSLLATKQGEPCVYSGTVELTQEGDMVSGPVELFLVSGPASCPAEMSGNLMATLEPGEAVGTYTLANGTITGGDPSGVSSVSGTLSPNPGGGGGFSVTQGDFEGTTGTWLATLQQSVLEIPVLGRVGLAALTLALLAAGAWILARSQAT